MANRGASAAVQAEWAKAQNRVCHLFEAHFDSGVVRATDAFRSIDWGGNTYIADGSFLTFDGVEESAELREARVSVRLSGVDQVWVRDALAETYLDRRLVIYKAFLNDRGEALIDPVPIFDGTMDAMSIEEDPDPGSVPAPGAGNCTVAVEAASAWADFGRRPGRHTNDNEQQLHFSGDKFFEFVSEINQPVSWGVPKK